MIEIPKRPNVRSESPVIVGRRIARFFLARSPTLAAVMKYAQPADIAFAAASIAHNQGQTELLLFVDYLDGIAPLAKLELRWVYGAEGVIYSDQE